MKGRFSLQVLGLISWTRSRRASTSGFWSRRLKATRQGKGQGSTTSQSDRRIDRNADMCVPLPTPNSSPPLSSPPLTSSVTHKGRPR